MLQKIALSFVGLSLLHKHKKLNCAEEELDTEDISTVVEEELNGNLGKHPPSTPKEIREQVTTKVPEDSMYTLKSHHRIPIELYNMMQGVKSLTELVPTDGLRFSISLQPFSSFRISSAWNYGMLSDMRSFDLCLTKFNSEQEEPSSYNDFVTAEYSGFRGFTAIGSLVLSKNLGIMLRGEGSLKPHFKNKKTFKDTLQSMLYMLEVRKLLGPAHIGIFRKQNSFGLNYLHRMNPTFSYGAQLGLTVF